MRASAATGLVAALAVGAVLSAGTAGGHVAHQGDRPKVIQLSYDESSGDIGPNRRLEAFSRHTGWLKFAVHHNGKWVRALGRYRSEITDTDIKGRRAKHPWVPDRRHGGSRVVRLVHKSLYRRGFAVVRISAQNSSSPLNVIVSPRIERSKCASDPPLYPLTCEVRL